MASTNQSPFYQKAEQEFLAAQTNEEKIHWLQEMIKECPKHKSAEKMLAQLKTRLKKLKEKIYKAKKSGKSSRDTIKKADRQAILIGYTNSGKSSLLAKLTNAHPTITEHEFTTQTPEIGTMKFQGVDIQIIELPSIKNKKFDFGIAYTADLIIIIVIKFEQIQEIKNLLDKIPAKKIIIFNKSDILNQNEKRKLTEKLKSKKHDFSLTSIFKDEEIEQLKEKILENFDIARIYLKEPGKPATDKPMIVKPNSTLEQVAKKISNSFAKTIKEVRIWGPSSKFGNQRVGLSHKIKDKDVVEFKTR